MSRLILSVSFVLAGVAVAVFLPYGARSLMILTAASAVAAVVYSLGRCHHPAPGLLPPTTGVDGAHVPARWFCADCGKTWATGFDNHETRPVVRYSGYDESKLVTAARRAEQLARHRRELAVRRAGIAGRPRKAGSTVTADVVAISRGRRLAK